MKKKEVKELNNKTVDQLKKAVTDIRQEIAQLQVDIALKTETNTAKRKELGRDLARNLTFLSMKQQDMVQSAVEAEEPKEEAVETKEEKLKKGESK